METYLWEAPAPVLGHLDKAMSRRALGEDSGSQVPQGSLTFRPPQGPAQSSPFAGMLQTCCSVACLRQAEAQAGPSLAAPSAAGSSDNARSCASTSKVMGPGGQGAHEAYTATDGHRQLLVPFARSCSAELGGTGSHQQAAVQEEACASKAVTAAAGPEPAPIGIASFGAWGEAMQAVAALTALDRKSQRLPRAISLLSLALASPNASAEHESVASRLDRRSWEKDGAASFAGSTQAVGPAGMPASNRDSAGALGKAPGQACEMPEHGKGWAKQSARYRGA